MVPRHASMSLFPFACHKLPLTYQPLEWWSGKRCADAAKSSLSISSIRSIGFDRSRSSSSICSFLLAIINSYDIGAHRLRRRPDRSMARRARGATPRAQHHDLGVLFGAAVFRLDTAVRLRTWTAFILSNLLLQHLHLHHRLFDHLAALSSAPVFRGLRISSMIQSLVTINADQRRAVCARHFGSSPSAWRPLGGTLTASPQR